MCSWQCGVGHARAPDIDGSGATRLRQGAHNARIAGDIERTSRSAGFVRSRRAGALPVTQHPQTAWNRKRLSRAGQGRQTSTRSSGPREPRSSRLRSERRMPTRMPSDMCGRSARSVSTTSSSSALGISNGCSATTSSITTITDRTRGSANRSLLSGQGTFWTRWRQRPRVTMTKDIPRLALSVVIVLAV